MFSTLLNYRTLFLCSSQDRTLLWFYRNFTLFIILVLLFLIDLYFSLKFSLSNGFFFLNFTVSYAFFICSFVFLSIFIHLLIVRVLCGFWEWLFWMGLGTVS